MCGLVGMVGDIYQKEKEVFAWLLFLDESRGKDSIGVGVINKKDEVILYKELGVTWHLMLKYDKVFDRRGVISDTNVKVLIGHNRFGTVGEKTLDNAHPFHHGNIIGAHNGTIDHEWRAKLPMFKEIGNDSSAIFHSINEIGLDETVKLMCGAWALTWFDLATNKMNFLTNGKRPLYYCFSQDKRTLFWASEKWMLELSFNKVGYKHHNINVIDPFEHHYITVSENLAKETLFYNAHTKYEGFIPPPVKTYYNYGHGGGQSNPFMGRGGGGTSVVVVNPPTKISITPPDVKSIMKGKEGKVIQFFINKECISKAGTTYLSAESSVVDENFELRIYNSSHKRWNEWRAAHGYYTGKVKKFINKNGECYLLIDTRTIGDETPWDDGAVDNTANELIEAINTKKEFVTDGKYPGFGNSVLTFTEFMKATAHGCAWCSSDVVLADITNDKPMRFIGSDEFICSDCMSLPGMDDYMVAMH